MGLSAATEGQDSKAFVRAMLARGPSPLGAVMLAFFLASHGVVILCFFPPTAAAALAEFFAAGRAAGVDAADAFFVPVLLGAAAAAPVPAGPASVAATVKDLAGLVRARLAPGPGRTYDSLDALPGGARVAVRDAVRL